MIFHRARISSIFQRVGRKMTTEHVPNAKPKVKAAILDIDGTLIDSNDAHARAFEQGLRENGFTVPYDEVRKLIGMGGDKLIPKLTGLDKDDPKFKAIGDRKSEVFSKHELPNLKPFPKAKELVQCIADNGIKIVIASSAKQEELEKFQKLIGIETLVAETSCSDDVDASKPDPDMIQVVLEKAKVSPEEALLIGDTPYDIESAARSGVKTVAVRCGGFWSEEDYNGAVAVYDSPEDLLNRFNESPFMVSSTAPS